MAKSSRPYRLLRFWITKHESRLFFETQEHKLASTPDSPHISPPGEAKSVRGPSGQRASRWPRAGVLDRLVSGLSHQRPGQRFSRDHETRDTNHGLSCPGRVVDARSGGLGRRLPDGHGIRAGRLRCRSAARRLRPGQGRQSRTRSRAQAETDSRGRYLLEDVPEGRVTLGGRRRRLLHHRSGRAGLGNHHADLPAGGRVRQR